MEVIFKNPTPAYSKLLAQLVTDCFASNLSAHDATMWGPAATAEAKIRLGWLDFANSANEILISAAELRSSLNAAHVNEIVLCGMGGSSLAPELISEWCNVPFTVLDATHPTQVLEQTTKNLSHTAVVVSSKSGTTAETRAHLAAFEAAFATQGIAAQERIILITDPGSQLEVYGRSQSYQVFLADPNVGGRFSALTAFGLVPPTLAGAELGPLVNDAEAALRTCLQDDAANPALQLAAALLSDPKAFIAAIAANSHEYHFLGDWIEQLVAESTGKDGKGVLPIAVQNNSPEFAADVLEHVWRIHLPEKPDHELAANEIAVVGDVGAQLVVWMVATAAIGYLLRLNPFDQPDVESAKVAARSALAESSANSIAAPLDAAAVTALGAQLPTLTANADYLMVQVFGPRTALSMTALAALRNQLATTLGIPVAANFGPRYLHSTGQFHKGGRGTGAFLQILVLPAADCDIPDGTGNTFWQLVRSQAAGDAAVLRDKGCNLLTVITDDLASVAVNLTHSNDG